jgi:hypothetical protein
MQDGPFIGLDVHKLCPIADQIGVDVHLGHVVDDHRHLAAVAVVQEVVQKRGLSGAKKAEKDGDWQAGDGLAFGAWLIML